MFDLKHCSMDPLSNQNDYKLFEFLIHFKSEYTNTVSKMDYPENLDNFLEYLEICFEEGRTHQFLVISNKTNKLCGTTFLYNSLGKNKISCFFSNEVRNTKITLEAVVFSLVFCLNLGYDTIYFSVYQSNSLMNRLAIKVGSIKYESGISLESGELVNHYKIHSREIQKLRSLVKI